MKTRLFLAALAASAVAVQAHAATLFAAYSTYIPFASPGVYQFSVPSLNSSGPGITVPTGASGLAYGDNALFVSSSQGASITRYDGGVATDSVSLAPLGAPHALAFGGNQLWASADVFVGNGTNHDIAAFDPTDLSHIGTSFNVSSTVTGLAASDSALFVAYGQTLASYDFNGNLLGSNLLGFGGFGPAPWSLAYGDGMIFAAYSTFSLPTSVYGIGVYDASTLALLGGWTTPTLANGLAFGNHSVFASLDSTIVQFDEAGTGLDENTSLFEVFGALAFAPDPPGGPIGGCRDTSAPCIGGGCVDTSRPCTNGGVPEPVDWVLMIVGFSGVGAALRARRRTSLGAA